MYKDVLTVAVVSYQPSWGDKEKNLNRIAGFAECAAKRGADIVLLPETALSGYDVVDPEGGECMHHRLAEPIGGPACQKLGETAKEHGIYIAFGLPERGDDGAVYNSAAVIGPDGDVRAQSGIFEPAVLGKSRVTKTSLCATGTPSRRASSSGVSSKSSPGSTPSSWPMVTTPVRSACSRTSR